MSNCSHTTAYLFDAVVYCNLWLLFAAESDRQMPSITKTIVCLRAWPYDGKTTASMAETTLDLAVDVAVAVVVASLLVVLPSLNEHNATNVTPTSWQSSPQLGW